MWLSVILVSMKRIILFALVVTAIVIGIYKYVADRQDGSSANSSLSQNESQKKQDPSLPLIDLQPTVDQWAAAQKGDFSVVIYDPANKKNVAELNPDKEYFAASIYKLYVAYEGYRKIDSGDFKSDEAYLDGWSRGKCLEEMIRSSHSPCGEKMWAELGKESTTARLEAYGLKNTSMTGLTTTARDASLILARLETEEGLSKQSKSAFLDSMKTQDSRYRRGLPSGFTQSTVYNKVGWNENLEWHDTAIITLPNGRNYVVSVFTRSVGMNQVAALGKAIEERLAR